MRRFLRRRSFLVGVIILAVGVALGLALARWKLLEPAVAQERIAPGAEARLKQLRIELPPVPTPVATYVPAVRVGNILYVSGHGPGTVGGKAIRGKVGRDVSLEEGNAAARAVGVRVLATARHSLGSLDKVVRVVKVLGMVNSTAEFKQQPQVINGFSDLMVEVFGKESGTAARSAVGMGSLPGGIPVEIEAIFQVRE